MVAVRPWALPSPAHRRVVTSMEARPVAAGVPGSPGAPGRDGVGAPRRTRLSPRTFARGGRKGWWGRRACCGPAPHRRRRTPASRAARRCEPAAPPRDGAQRRPDPAGGRGRAADRSAADSVRLVFCMAFFFIEIQVSAGTSGRPRIPGGRSCASRA